MKSQIELTAEQIKTAAAGMSKVICRSSTLPMLKSLRLSATSSGNISIDGTDLDNFATFRTSAIVPPGPDGEVIVPWEQFTALTKSCKDRAIFVGEAKDRLIIQTFIGSNRIEKTVETSGSEEWPAEPPLAGDPIPVNESFKTALAEAMDCACTDGTRFLMNSAFLDVTRPDAHYVVGTDGRHLFSANSFSLGLKESIIIPIRKWVGWKGLVDDGSWSLRVYDNEKRDAKWVEVASDHWSFRTKLVDGNYPNWKQILPSETVASLQFDQEAIRSLKEILPQLPGANMYNEPITLRVQSNSLVVQARSETGGKIFEVPVMGVRIEGKPIKVSMNRQYFMKALKMGFTGLDIPEGAVVVFTAPGRKLVVACLRDDEAPPPPVAAASSPTPPPPQSTDSAQAEATNHSPPSQEAIAAETNQERSNPMTITNGAVPSRTASNRTNEEESSSSFKSAIEAIEQVKTKLREVLSDLTETAGLLKAAEKEKKSTEKEIESVRSTLRSLQKIEI